MYMTVANPLTESIADAERIINDLAAASKWLQQAIQEEREAYGRLKDVQDTYDGAEAEYMAEYAVEAATAKSGPLAGIPVSSEGYKFTVASLKTKLRHGDLADMWQDLDACRLQHERAGVERQQAETEFNTQRKLAELKAMILRASSI